MAAACRLTLCSSRSGMRNVTMDHMFYTGYRKNVLTSDEVLVAITIPYTKDDEHFVAYKQAREVGFYKMNHEMHGGQRKTLNIYQIDNWYFRI
jgi:hypothetical protein